MRLLITGDREWIDESLIAAKLVEIGCPSKITVLMHGNARGADKLAEKVALRLGLPKMKIWRFHADWDLYGAAAGPIRNRCMFKWGEPTQALAFHNNFAQSSGTKDMVAILRKASIPTWCSWEALIS